MNEKEFPYVVECSFCGNGLLRAYRCGSCQFVSAICDECELMWQDVEAVFEDPQQEANGAFPICCHCQAEEPKWEKLDFTNIAEAGLDQFITDHSE